jgi:hypothetical protein
MLSGQQYQDALEQYRNFQTGGQRTGGGTSPVSSTQNQTTIKPTAPRSPSTPTAPSAPSTDYSLSALKNIGMPSAPTAPSAPNAPAVQPGQTALPQPTASPSAQTAVAPATAATSPYMTSLLRAGANLSGTQLQNFQRNLEKGYFSDAELQQLAAAGIDINRGQNSPTPTTPSPTPTAAPQAGSYVSPDIQAAIDQYGPINTPEDQALGLYFDPDDAYSYQSAAQRREQRRQQLERQAVNPSSTTVGTSGAGAQIQQDVADQQAAQNPPAAQTPGAPATGGTQTGGNQPPVTQPGGSQGGQTGGQTGGQVPGQGTTVPNSGTQTGGQTGGQTGDNNPLVGSNGDGGTAFNPGGGTNPDGTNPTVPQGNQNNGTSPSVYQLRPQGQTESPYTVTDNMRQQVQNSLANGDRWQDLNGAQQENMLEVIRQGTEDGTFDWFQLRNRADIRDAYIARYGDPIDSLSGATDNTVREDGGVQGQFEGEQGRAFQAISSDAAENNRDVGDNELSSTRMTDILSQDGALMQLAQQRGVEAANARGMRNSSISAGAQMRAMADAATPLALQEADVYNRTGMQNQNLESMRRDSNANRQTQTSVTNAGMANDLMNSDRQRDLSYNLQQLAGDQDYAKQELAGQLAADIANIEGQYKQIISDNDTAARLFDSYYDTVAEVVGNSEFGPDEANGRVQTARREFEAGMEMILGFENFDLATPTSGGPGGSGGQIPPFGTPEYAQWLQQIQADFNISNLGLQP